MPRPGGIIYAIRAVGTPWVKIGCTTGPVIQRVKALQTGQPFPLQVLAAIPVETDAQRIEKQVHAFLIEEKRRGEWFEVPMDLPTLEALIVRAVAYLAAQETAQGHGEGEADEDFPPRLGQRIQRAREAAGMTQAELAAATGLNQGHISRIERAGSQEVMAETLLRREIQAAVGTDRPLADVLRGLWRRGRLARVGAGRYALPGDNETGRPA